MSRSWQIHLDWKLTDRKELSRLRCRPSFVATLSRDAHLKRACLPMKVTLERYQTRYSWKRLVILRWKSIRMWLIALWSEWGLWLRSFLYQTPKRCAWLSDTGSFIFLIFLFLGSAEVDHSFQPCLICITITTCFRHESTSSSLQMVSRSFLAIYLSFPAPSLLRWITVSIRWWRRRVCYFVYQRRPCSPSSRQENSVVYLFCLLMLLSSSGTDLRICWLDLCAAFPQSTRRRVQLPRVDYRPSQHDPCWGIVAHQEAIEKWYLYSRVHFGLHPTLSRVDQAMLHQFCHGSLYHSFRVEWYATESLVSANSD